ncbi:MAG: Na+/H+ antiporter subunit E, partial [Bacteroidota bacterium]
MAMKIIYLAEFVVFYIYSLFKANLRLAWDIITPGIPFMPGIVRV